MAKEYGLELKYKEEFHEVFAEHQEHPEFGPLMVRMKVVEPNGESSMDEDQWEAASAYWWVTREMNVDTLSRYLYRFRFWEKCLMLNQGYLVAVLSTLSIRTNYSLFLYDILELIVCLLSLGVW